MAEGTEEIALSPSEEEQQKPEEPTKVTESEQAPPSKFKLTVFIY